MCTEYPLQVTLVGLATNDASCAFGRFVSTGKQASPHYSFTTVHIVWLPILYCLVANF